MAAPVYEYVALRTIETNGVRAYNTDDGVPASAVVNLGLVVGEDVAEVDPKRLAAAREAAEQAAAETLPADLIIERPGPRAAKPDWVEYARSRGVSTEEAEGMSIAQLRDRFPE
jgi:hypothetical protein